jgi:hypothetical protein
VYKFYSSRLTEKPKLFLSLISNKHVTLIESFTFSTTAFIDVMLKYVKKYGGVLLLHGGPIRKTLLISDYKFLEHVLSSTKILNKSDDYHFFRPWLGTGLLTSDGNKTKCKIQVSKHIY